MNSQQRVTGSGIRALAVVALALVLGILQLPGAATAQVPDDPSSVRRAPIAVDLKVRPLDVGTLALRVSYFNPYRCAWLGHLFLERGDASGGFRTLARVYDVTIPGGSRLTGTVVIVRPPSEGPHIFVARAYHPDGGDQEEYFSGDDTEPDGDVVPPGGEVPELVLGDETIDAWFDLAESNRPDRPGDQVPCDGEAGPGGNPISVELSLTDTPGQPDIDVEAVFDNTTRRAWRGDVYVDMTGPDGGVQIVRRDLGVLLRPGVGFSTWDRVPRPGPPGVFLFTARALRRDGSHQVRWIDPGTTEIVAVCNGEICEPITPEQDRANILLTGWSAIHLMSDFFSEFTTVRMAYDSYEFDITDLCELLQYQAGPRYHIEVRFNSFDLPIGPRTWARYTIELHPMPPVPPDAKLSDSLWILTNGPE